MGQHATDSDPGPAEMSLWDALGRVADPELGSNVVDLGMVRSVSVSQDGGAVVEIALTMAACPMRDRIRGDVERAARSVPGIGAVEVRTSVMDREQKRRLIEAARLRASRSAPSTSVPPDAPVTAVASGKGGVGKSSIAVNLAFGLAASGRTVGLLDADVWGFSVPRMVGLAGSLTVQGGRDDWQMKPVAIRCKAGLVKVVSMGLIAQDEDQAIMWRGPMLARALQHFVEDADWSGIDHLVVDMPPGTGDIQMGLAKMLPAARLIVVTTPAATAAKIAVRVSDMAASSRLGLMGVVENMSSFTCDHGATYHLFGEGGGEALAGALQVPLLAKLPFDPAQTTAADHGQPAVLDPEAPLGRAFERLAEAVDTESRPVPGMESCTARTIEAVPADARPPRIHQAG